jgi:DNA-binding response OmpR family regulator
MAEEPSTRGSSTPGHRRVLVVDDEPTIAASVAARLRAEGFTVDVAHDGPSAMTSFLANEPDLVVLDVMLPGFDGLEVCRRIQAVRSVPVLMLTARDAETDLLVGLAVGADDYLTKPFSIRELAARVHVLFRRVARAAEAHERAQQRIALGELEIDLAQRRVWCRGEPAHLTPIEFDLLVHLAGHPRTVLPREALLAQVWGWADAGGTRTVDSHVKAIRRKLGAELIRTVHGVGYALEVPK